MSLIRGARSWLFVPGDRPERFATAAASGADTVIIDLEDAISAAEKSRARAEAVRWLARDQRAWVRINALGTPWFGHDAEALCRVVGRGLEGVLVPKADSRAGLERVAAELPDDLPLVPLVETARGVLDAEHLGAASQVVRMALGTLDLALDAGIGHDPDALLFARSRLVLASRAAGLPGPIDGVTLATRDQRAVAADVQRSRRLGFTGKLCIHPAQVEAVHRCLRPSDDELEWSRRTVAAADEAVATVDGELVDRPQVERARVLLGRVGPADARTERRNHG